jgi:S-formylglutathione hydrolase FrmB
MRFSVATLLILALPAASALGKPDHAGRPDPAGEAGTVVTGTAPPGAAGVEIEYAAYLPPGYDTSDDTYASIYLLHGRGDTMAAWQQVTDELDELIGRGDIPPLIAVMPDAPWSDRGSWYVDSEYTGGAVSPGTAVETALTLDLVGHIDEAFRTVPDRRARAVGGYSMGGYGALRYALARQDVFAAGLILSPAVYVPLPPADSSARDFGGFGSGDALFDPGRYDELTYPSLLPHVDAELPTRLFLAVGDDEWTNPDPEEARHDIESTPDHVGSEVIVCRR